MIDLGNDPPLAQFANGMVLNAATVVQKPLRVDLIWKTAKPLDRDYTVSVKLVDENERVVAQHDSLPQLNRRPTRSWTIDEIVYSPHVLESTQRWSSGEYRIVVQVYFLESGTASEYPYRVRRRRFHIGIDVPGKLKRFELIIPADVHHRRE